jgi:hypothetical protein
MKLGKILKRIFWIFLILIGLIIGAMIAIPYFFKDELLEAIKQTANDNLQATLDFEDANLSFFRQFPQLSVQMDELSIKGKGVFEGISLVQAKTVEAAVDVMSVIQSDRPVDIRSIQLDEPDVRIYVLKDGSANYDIAVASETTSQDTSSANLEGLRILLQEYGISNGRFIYEDQTADIALQIGGLNHSGKGDFTLDVYDLITSTTIDSLSVESGGVRYLKNAAVDLDATLQADMPNMKFTLKDNRLLLNALQLAADGFVALPDDKITMDLTFKAPNGDFRELFSLIPNAFIEGYEQVKIDGKFELEGSVKGAYFDDHYPAFQVNTSIAQGAVQYPDLPLGIGNIKTNIAVKSPEGDLDGMQIDIPDFNLAIGKNPISGSFRLRTPISDPDIDTRIKGQVDLKELGQAFPIEGLKELAGRIQADITAKTKMSTINKGQYEQVNMAGTASVQNVVYASSDYPKIQIKTGNLQFTPQKVNVQDLDMLMGKSDLKASGAIDNILAYFSPKQTMKGDFTVRSQLLDANEWVTETSSSAPPATNGSPAEEEGELFNRFDFSLDAQVGEILYDTYRLQNNACKGQMTPNRLLVDELRTEIEGSDIKASGLITNIWDYLFEDGVLGGNLSIVSNTIDLNPFMVTEEGASSETGSTGGGSYEPIQVPKNIDMTLNAKVDQLQYTDLLLKDLDGKLVVADQIVALENFEAKGLDGQMAFNGAYDTQDPEKPAFNLKYDLSQLDFQKTFQAFNTFQSLAPVGKYIEGKFTSTLVLEGILGQDMMPDLSTLSAQGFLETVNGFVKGYPPLQAIGNQLKTDAFENLDLQNTRNWFEIKNGSLEVKEFDYQVKDIDMKIGGSHSIVRAQEMDYSIKAKIPRELLGNNVAGEAVEGGLSTLRKEAGKLGVEWEKSEFVNVQIQLTGGISKPKVGIKLLGTEGKASLKEAAEDKIRQEIDEEKEKLKEQGKEKLEEGKEQAKIIVEQAKDTITGAVQQKVDETKEKLEQQAKDALEEKGKESVDDIKKKLENWNPFKDKKKKKKNN